MDISYLIAHNSCICPGFSNHPWHIILVDKETLDTQSSHLQNEGTSQREWLFTIPASPCRGENPLWREERKCQMQCSTSGLPIIKRRHVYKKTITHASCLLLLGQQFQSVMTTGQHRTIGDNGRLSHASLFWSPAFSTDSERLFEWDRQRAFTRLKLWLSSAK